MSDAGEVVCPVDGTPLGEPHVRDPADDPAGDGEPDPPSSDLDASDPEALAPGTMVGEYRIEARLGAGGFGAVYRAIHPVIEKPAAVKVLRGAYSSDPDVSRRFVDEARAVHRIGHRNIVDIFGFGALPDGRLYFVMELLIGESLEAKLQRERRLSVAETIALLEPLAEALDAAHAAGVVHRDLKPDNVFLPQGKGDTKAPKLLDFGVAKLLGEGVASGRSQTGALMGTPLYMSPEQIEGEKVDFRADLYALGVMVFRMLTGRHPFVGKTSLATMVMHAEKPRPRASEVWAGVPAELDEVIAGMLAIDPAKRPPSAAALVESLRVGVRGAGDEEVMALGLAATGVGEREAPPSLASGPTERSPTPGVPARSIAVEDLATGPTEIGRVAEARADAGAVSGAMARTDAGPVSGAMARTGPVTGPVVDPATGPAMDRAAGTDPSASDGAGSETSGGGVVTRSRGGLRVGAIALVVAAIVGGAAWWRDCAASAGPTEGASTSGPGAAATTPPKPLALEGEIVACPIWEAKGVTAPTGWLGARASHAACEVLDIWRGVRRETMVPAELLDLPRAPADGFPTDPYGAPDARQRSLATSEARAAVVMDGEVERLDDSFAVRISLRRGGDTLGEVHKRGESLELSIHEALRELVERGVVPRAERLTQAAWALYGTQSVEGVVLLDELFRAPPTPATDARKCEALRSLLGRDAFRSIGRQICDPTSEAWRKLPAMELERESNVAFAFTSAMRGSVGTPSDWRSLQGEANKRRATETSIEVRSALALAEAYAWFHLEETERARASAVEAFKEVNHSGAVMLLGDLARGTDAGDSASSFGAAWCAEADWTGVATSPPLRLQHKRRAFEFWRRRDSAYALLYVSELISAGRLSDARVVASAFIAGGDEHRFAGETMLATVEEASRNVGAAVNRMVAAVTAADWDGLHANAISMTLRRADVLGRPQAAEGWVKRFILPAGSPGYTDPVRQAYLWVPMLALCVRAGPNLGPRCFKRFDEVLAIDSFYATFSPAERPLAEGARAFVAGDVRAAAAAWRKVDPTHPFYSLIVKVEAFDQAGDVAYASKVDQILIARGLHFVAGAHPAHVREARRAAKRGDLPRAKELAKIVVDAWGRADVPIPSIPEMQAILDR